MFNHTLGLIQKIATVLQDKPVRECKWMKPPVSHQAPPRTCWLHTYLTDRASGHSFATHKHTMLKQQGVPHNHDLNAKRLHLPTALRHDKAQRRRPPARVGVPDETGRSHQTCQVRGFPEGYPMGAMKQPVHNHYDFRTYCMPDDGDVSRPQQNI